MQPLAGSFQKNMFISDTGHEIKKFKQGLAGKILKLFGEAVEVNVTDKSTMKQHRLYVPLTTVQGFLQDAKIMPGKDGIGATFVRTLSQQKQPPVPEAPPFKGLETRKYEDYSVDIGYTGMDCVKVSCRDSFGKEVAFMKARLNTWDGKQYSSLSGRRNPAWKDGNYLYIYEVEIPLRSNNPKAFKIYDSLMTSISIFGQSNGVEDRISADKNAQNRMNNFMSL